MNVLQSPPDSSFTLPPPPHGSDQSMTSTPPSLLASHPAHPSGNPLPPFPTLQQLQLRLQTSFDITDAESPTNVELSTSAMSVTDAEHDSIIVDTGATSVLLRESMLEHLANIYTASTTLPPAIFDLPDGGTLRATSGGHLRFPGHPHPIPCYVCPDTVLSHNLLAASPLLGAGGKAVFTATSVHFYSTPSSPLPFLSGSKTPLEGLWCLDIPSPSSQPFTAMTMTNPTIPTIHNVVDASWVAYIHRSFGSPVLSTFTAAVKANYISIPRLTPRILERNPPQSLHTSFGHLDRVRQGLRSTRKGRSPPAVFDPVTRSRTKALMPIPIPDSLDFVSTTVDPTNTDLTGGDDPTAGDRANLGASLMSM